MPRTTVQSDATPAAIGPYSHAAQVSPSGLLYLSGQPPIDPSSGKLVAGDMTGQTKQVFSNLAAVLASASGSLDDVMKVNVYLTSMADFAEMNAVYETVFAGPFPAPLQVSPGWAASGPPA